MSFHICCTYPLIDRVQLSIPTPKRKEATESARVLQTLCYAMLCYAMFIEQKSEPGRKRSAATQNLRQKVQNERQEASGDPT